MIVREREPIGCIDVADLRPRVELMLVVKNDRRGAGHERVPVIEADRGDASREDEGVMTARTGVAKKLVAGGATKRASGDDVAAKEEPFYGLKVNFEWHEVIVRLLRV